MALNSSSFFCRSVSVSSASLALGGLGVAVAAAGFLLLSSGSLSSSGPRKASSVSFSFLLFFFFLTDVVFLGSVGSSVSSESLADVPQSNSMSSGTREREKRSVVSGLSGQRRRDQASVFFIDANV